MYNKKIEISLILLALACLGMMKCLDSQPKITIENGPCIQDTIVLNEGKMIYDSTKSKHWKLIPSH